MNDSTLKETIAAARTGYARNGERGLLEGLYTVQTRYYAAGKVSGMDLARTCVRLGKKQEALQLLEEGYAGHSSSFSSASLSDPILLALKDEPRYKALVKKLNLPPTPQDASPGTVSAPENSPSRAVSDPR
jgi:hypothetical protein